ncbi:MULTISPECIES: LLM class flavin-dependent oxidoreductase [unclassified Bradyrhizobium]|uniref:LLM class flavin-dependent oxidoreductase n=1 Tax=unclassified Bradyrhizobium TaxID=2631580 RepID=UPI0020B2A010|nr:MULTISPECIES: LLM class flavin-dependent oxidoreductase [unclassified Bradyrhizobium]MCP3396999.1 LLM class flavin-dependent oxidoreductase [Bradyrhizobium sp. CCGB20]MCP3405511.1 LLM class flavin-dependent oxidoreductase [Bradyrhizobium sp. CCGB01]
MKFGVFYEHQLPQPCENGGEQKMFSNALEQIELADRIGFNYIWQVERHFLKEYSHSSAPEVFLGWRFAAYKEYSHLATHLSSPPRHNHPARLTERLATLDLISGGHVEWGTGESASLIEMDLG